MELDPKYVDVAIRRWQSVTGDSADLAGSGETFDDVRLWRTGAVSAAPDSAPKDVTLETPQV